jgi:peptide/nickel transport system substrate-binding protein
MKEHCDAFAKVPGTIADIRRFVETSEMNGVRAADEHTVVFRLEQPASDFLNILAMPFASPVPAEYLDYLPDSPEFRQHTISNGPYQIVTYTPNREIQFERNPVWSSATDPLRPAHVDRISIIVGIDQQLTQLQLQAGTADLSFGISPPTSEIAALLEIGDPRLMLTPPGDYFSGFYYLSVNVVGPEKDGPLLKPEVRLALEYAVNKAAIAQVQGGPSVSRPARQAVSSAVTGYRPGADMYETPMDRGNPEKARQLLAQAGYANGLSLKLAHVQTTTASFIAQTLQESFRRAGIDVQLTPYTAADYYGRLLDNADNARRGVWDLALATWYPDWNGANNSRSVIQPLFDGRNFGHGSSAYGGYNSDEINALIDRALSTPAFDEAEKLWAEAAGRILKDGAIVPLVEFKAAYYRSSRIRNCLVNMWSLNCDMTGVWLDGDRP